ncbi:MAG TPA: TatD family hydrolase, partial [bacterium]
MELVDTHAHLDHPPLADDAGGALARAQAAGVRYCLTMGTSVESSRKAVALAERHPGVLAAVGIHPHDAEQADAAALEAIEALAAHPRVVAIGEVGLDLSRKGAPGGAGQQPGGASPVKAGAPLAAQERALRAFLAMARRADKPIAIHCRDAYEELLRLAGESPGGVRGVLHCASGPPAFIERAL